ncbi:MAG: response regulator transcription factor [Planctomycetota bacterium]|jgi:DNA-binding NarL/FixJ family response regulator
MGRVTDMGGRGGRGDVFIVDDHPIVREGLTFLIEQEKDLRVCGAAGSGREALEFFKTSKPDAVVLDLSLGDMNGLQLLKKLRERLGSLPVLVLSVHDEQLYAERVLRAGALGYIQKDEATEKVVEGIRRVIKGEVFVSETVSSKILKTLAGGKNGVGGLHLDRLTDRELEVFEWLGRGLTTRGISGKLHISVKTVESHQAHIKEKLNLNSGRELILHAVKWWNDQGDNRGPS